MSLEVVILAAGQGTRMKSELPKVLHPVAGTPLLQHVVETALQLEPRAIHAVVGHCGDQVREALAQFDLNWITQQERLGTGHAVLQALPDLQQDSVVLILYGDVPLTEVETLRALIDAARDGTALLTATLQDASGYGRILRNVDGDVIGVVEDKDASSEQRSIREINTGLLAAPYSELAEYLPRVKNENNQGEYYLPDILSLAVANGKRIASCSTLSELEILGVNDRVQLNQVEREYQRRQAESLMRAGVSIADAGRIDIRGTLTCAEDVSIDVNCVFEGDVQLERGVSVGANCVVKNAHVGCDTNIHPMSHIEDAQLGEKCSVGPYARLRPGTVMANGARVGNFVETKKATIGTGSKINHLSYIGDCDMGSGVNIGAGTITCNYDGANKFQTQIGNDVFVGSNSTLVAPLQIAGEGFVAAGSTVTKPVSDGDLAVGRARQRNISGWERPHKEKK